MFNKKSVFSFIVFLMIFLFSSAWTNEKNNSVTIDMNNLIKDVNLISPLGTPGSLHSNVLTAMPVVGGDEDTTPDSATVVMASLPGKGRVIALGHWGFLGNKGLVLFDNKQFAINIANWLDEPLKKKKMLVTIGHDEQFGHKNLTNFKAVMEQEGFKVFKYKDRIDYEILKKVNIVVIGNAYKHFKKKELTALRKFVYNGGSLLLAGIGWEWLKKNKGKKIKNYPMNRIGKRFGIVWLDSYITDETDNYKKMKERPAFHIFYAEHTIDDLKPEDEVKIVEKCCRTTTYRPCCNRRTYSCSNTRSYTYSNKNKRYYVYYYGSKCPYTKYRKPYVYSRYYDSTPYCKGGKCPYSKNGSYYYKKPTTKTKPKYTTTTNNNYSSGGKSWNDNMYRKYNYSTFYNYGPANQKINASKPDYALLSAAIFYETNKRRTAYRLSPFKHNTQARKAAQMHSNDMVKQNFFSHTNPNRGKSSPTDRYKMCGGNSGAAENIAAGYGGWDYYSDGKHTAGSYISLAQYCLNMWMKSTGHRQNILSNNKYLGAAGAIFNKNGFKATQVITSR